MRGVPPRALRQDRIGGRLHVRAVRSDRQLLRSRRQRRRRSGQRPDRRRQCTAWSRRPRGAGSDRVVRADPTSLIGVEWSLGSRRRLTTELVSGRRTNGRPSCGTTVPTDGPPSCGTTMPTDTVRRSVASGRCQLVGDPSAPESSPPAPAMASSWPLTQRWTSWVCTRRAMAPMARRRNPSGCSIARSICAESPSMS